MGSILLLSGLLLAPPAAAQDCRVDADADGYVSAADCPENGTDCDDANPRVHPFAREIPSDGIDQDCDGEDFVAPCDADADGFQASFCGGDDCDDQDPDIHPGAQEFDGDGVDQDCNGFDDCPPVEWVQGGLGCASAPAGGEAALAGALALAALLRRRREGRA